MPDERHEDGEAGKRNGSNQVSGDRPAQISVPTIPLPKGGGAIRGIGEKFAANSVTGTGSMAVPITVTPGRAGFSPELTLSYDSGSGNGPFGWGWSLSLPRITRKTDKGLPKYDDRRDSDVFILSGAEDLVPVLIKDGNNWKRDSSERTVNGVHYEIQRYRPRIEGLFARIERWTDSETEETHWRSISKDNVTTFYGKASESRIFDPDDPKRIFEWLICETRDDKGYAIIYDYASENSDNVDPSQANERNRTIKGRATNRYLKRIKYGNRKSHLVQPDLSQTEWLFEVVFDYDEGHYQDLPTAADGSEFANANLSSTRPWPVRQDAFSTYRAGFENRTYRLCRRALMFHHFPEELGTPDCLVKSTEFQYKESRIASFITSVTQSGFVRKNDGTYLKKSLPPVEFEYSEAVVKNEVFELDAQSLENLPYGPGGTRYRWADLDGEGISGILTEQANTWFYKPNAGNGHFGPVEVVASKPAIADLTASQQLLDLAGDGQLDLVQFGHTLAGFHERTDEGGWSNFNTFSSLPVIDWNNPNLKFVDLTGDGHADILISEDEIFTWHPSLAEDGFGPAVQTRQAFDEEKGPRLVFSDATQSALIADITGDGLGDFVRIRNGEVCFWPNLGYGRFGAKVTMDNAPWFDSPDQFDGRRIRPADIDGSGVTDIIYLKETGIDLYFNQSGNSWSRAQRVEVFPDLNNESTVTVVDLLGDGTACIVWSSTLPGHARRPVRYLPLMKEKPHLLLVTKNNIGAETHVQYASSTKFYLADKAAGKPWITRLAFPVHVVERIETLDRISRNRFVTRYAYHHGYFDGIEREFRGFGMVEQFDTEEFATLSASDMLPDATNIELASHVPPVLTKTWFHTGAYFEAGRISKQFEHEYYREGDPSRGEGMLTDEQLEAMLLPDTVLPDGLSVEEEREACRALKGSVLRQEIYARDNTDKEDRPYSVTERNYTIRSLQPRDGNQHSVFFTHARETVDFHYERQLYDVAGQKHADPRVAHSVVLEVDDFGNQLKAVAIGYGRRVDDPLLTPADRAKQKQTILNFNQNDYTNVVDESDAHRTPLVAEARTFELLKVAPQLNQSGTTNLFRFQELANQVTSASDGQHDLPYEDFMGTGATENHAYRRLIEHVRTIYRSNDLSSTLPLRQLQSLGLSFETYQLAFTPGLLQVVYGERVTDTMMNNEGGYVHSDGDANWWIPSGRIFYSENKTDSSSTELANAQQHFFLPKRFLDPFGFVTTLTYDSRDLLLVETVDALGNSIRSQNNYRVMLPALVTDPNGNRSQFAFDALGLIVGTALMGKATENLGDSLSGFEPDLDPATILAHQQNPFLDPHAILMRASTRMVYDLKQYQRTAATSDPQPNFVYTLLREIHDADLGPGEKTRVQHSFSYSDGFGREIQKKMQAEPGSITADGPVINPRWVGSGWIIFNNKGKAIRRYEPFFSQFSEARHRFEFGVQVGVSQILFYDPLERVIAKLHPDATYEKVTFDPWQQITYDGNDTIAANGSETGDARTDEDIKGFVSGYFKTQPNTWQTWLQQRIAGAMGAAEQSAAQKAAKHANTPTITYSDSLDRPILTVVHNRLERNGITVDEKYATRLLFDVEGNQRAIIDTLGRTVMRYSYDLLGKRIQQASMEAGERWFLDDVSGKPIREWNSRGFSRRISYDELRRPTGLFVNENGIERLAERTVYGENAGVANNHRTRVHHVFDAAGRLTSEAYDFKGNLLRSSRDLLPKYKDAVDWLTNPDPSDGSFVIRTSYDALNRAVVVTTPDNSVHRSIYNEANLVDRIEVNLRGAVTPTTIVSNINYNAKGQRELIHYGNGTETKYEYDRFTFRLARLTTTRPASSDAISSQLFKSATVVQDLLYTHDAAGNITRIEDAALKTIFHNNEEVVPVSTYTYDATYRLIEATGREHIAQSAFDFANEDRRDFPFLGLRASSNDQQAMRNYMEQYDYDEIGNFKFMRHVANGETWVRTYEYQEDSLLEPGLHKSNRLTRSTINGQTETYDYTDAAGADVNGCITGINNMTFEWNFKDELQQVNLGGGGTAYYVYDSDGQRVRKVIDTQNGTRRQQRIYLGGFELYREYATDGTTVTLARETLHIMEGRERIAVIETRTEGSDSASQQLIRFQLSNHLSSSSVELSEEAQLISYEEYSPYGSTSFQAMRGQTETPKRYRYTGKERDHETGLIYCQARYYSPWLGRWISCDPSENERQRGYSNVYVFCRDCPLVVVDPDGRDIVVLKESKISAKDLVDKIKKDESIPQQIRDSINVDPKNPSSITFKQGLKGGKMSEADAAVWNDWAKLYTEAEVAARDKDFAFTTGELRILPGDEKTPRTIGSADVPTESVGMLQGKDFVGFKSNLLDVSEPDHGIGGITLPSVHQAEVLKQEKRETGGKVVSNTLSDQRGLLVVVDRIITNEKQILPSSDREIVHTFFHELGLHAGGIVQDKVGIGHGTERVDALDKLVDKLLPTLNTTLKGAPAPSETKPEQKPQPNPRKPK